MSYTVSRYPNKKMLTGRLLVCAVMALSTAVALPEEIAKSDQAAVESQLEKRWTMSCSSGWTLINGRCFRYVPSSLTWAQAERNCKYMGGTLASVHSAHEHSWMRWLVTRGARYSRTTWIGGSDAQQERVWLWSDGSPFSFSNWCRGQPNNLGGRQHCLQMNFSAYNCWNDMWCYARLPSICVKRNK